MSSPFFSNYPLEFEGEVPTPDTIPGMPEDLENFLGAHHKGMDRIVVRIWRGGKDYVKVGPAIVLDGAYNEKPKATVPEIGRAIMAVAQDYYESVDRFCKFQVQAKVYKNETGPTKKKTAHIELGKTQEGLEFAKDAKDPVAHDQLLYGMLQMVFSEWKDAATKNQELANAIIPMLGSAFQYRDAAQEEVMGMRQILMDMMSGSEAEKRKSERWEKGFGILKEIADKATPVVAAAIAQAKFGGGAAAVQAAAAPAAGAPPTSTRPSWAGGSKKPKPEPPTVDTTATPKPPPDGGGAGAGASAQQSAQVPLGNESVPATATTPLQIGKALYASISGRQWPQLAIILTKAELNAFVALADVEDEAAMWDQVRALTAKMNEQKFAKITRLVSTSQMVALMTLKTKLPKMKVNA